MTASVPPALYPVNVDASDGTFNVTGHKLFVDYDQETGKPTRVRVYDPQLQLVLDEPAVSVVAGSNPRLVAHRHQLGLADGRVLYVQVTSGGCCGNRPLKNFKPDGTTSGWRP